MVRLLPPSVLLLSLAGCGSDQQFGKAGDYNGAQGPVIEVTPPEVDFGALAAGEVATGTFTVANIGPEESILQVSDIRIMGPSEGFTLLSEETSHSLHGGVPGVEFEVAFSPMGANEQRSEAIVDSNDEATPHKSVKLLGEGLVPELEIDPDPLDMGTTYVGCTRSNQLTLTNIGTDTLVVDSLTQTGDGFTFTNPNAMPLTLEPGDDTTVQLLFAPWEEVDYPSEVVATSNEPIGVRTATQTAAGQYAGEGDDHFEVPTDPPSDIIFFVDQSCSMDDDATSLANNFEAFITQLSTYTTDWHIIVANDDDGCNNTGILTSSTTNYQSRFETAVSAGGGVWTEAGLTVTGNAVDETDSGECNSGFLRADALLHIIMVSDEPEQSLRSWDTYVNAVVTKKGDAARVKYSAVAGDVPGGCRSGSNSADPGTGYYDAVNYTGGEFLSLCSNWSSSVGVLADASVSMSTFTLTRTPVPDTITVAVNGVDQPGGWNYDATTNSVEFDPAYVPGEGDVVDVAYALLATCD